MMTRSRRALRAHHEERPDRRRRGLLRLELLPELAALAIACVGACSLVAWLANDSGVDSWNDDLANAAAPVTPAMESIVDLAALSDRTVLVVRSCGRLDRLSGDASHDRGAGRVAEPVLREPGRLHRLAAAPSGGDAAIGGTTDGSIVVWECVRDPADKPQVLSEGHGYVTSVAIDPTGDWGASAGVDQTVCLWRLSDRSRAWSGSTGSSHALAVAFSPDSTRLAWVTLDGLSILTLGDLQVAHVSTAALCESPTTLAFSPDSRRLAIGAVEGEILLWNVGEGRREWVSNERLGTIRCAAMSPDGETVFVSRGSGALEIRDCSTGEALGVVRAHPCGAQRLAMSPEGRQIISAGSDGLVRWWDLESMHAVP